MKFNYLIYAYYRHSPKFISKFDTLSEAEKFKENFTKQEQNVIGFEFCHIEVTPH
jgi:hypothetical protein